MRKLLAVLIGLMVAGAAFAGVSEDASPVKGPVQTTPCIDAQWDVLLQFDAEALVVDNQLLGCEFAGGNWIITGGGNAVDPNKLYKVNAAGTQLLSTVNQPATATGWGVRDLAFDGTYLYGGCEATTIFAFDPVTLTNVTAMNIPRPAGVSVVRALAYDPATDHFWTGNFSSNIVEFTRTGSVVWQGAPPTGWTGIYGMAWDNAPGHSPILWIFDQTGTPLTQIKGFNPVTHAATGVVHQVALLSGLTDQIAGGLAFTNQWNPAFYTFAGIVQGTAHDKLFALEMYPSTFVPPNVNINLTPINPPITIPAAGGAFSFNAQIQNLDTVPATFQVWTLLRNATTTVGPMLGPLSFTGLPAGANITRTRNQNVAATVPAGTYNYIGFLGQYSATNPTVYDSSYFQVVKSAVDNGSPFVGNNDNWGEDFTFDGVAPASYALVSNFPNPFNPTTTIRYNLAQAGNVRLAVFDLQGKQVAELVNGYRDMGNHEVTFNANGLASGMYIYRLTAGDQVASGKMMFLK